MEKGEKRQGGAVGMASITSGEEGIAYLVREDGEDCAGQSTSHGSFKTGILSSRDNHERQVI